MKARQAPRRPKLQTEPSSKSPSSSGAPPKTAKVRKADRREIILEIAARRFSKFGYEATTIREIGDDASLLSGSIYHHFDTKDEILDEIIRDTVADKRNVTVKIANSNADAELRLTALILLDLEGMTSSVEAHTILYNDRKYLRRNPPFGYVSKAKGDMYKAWESVLKAGTTSGLFKITNTFFAISTMERLLNTFAEWYSSRDEVDYGDIDFAMREDEAIDLNLEFVLSAIRHPSREAEPIPRRAAEELLLRQR